MTAEQALHLVRYARRRYTSLPTERNYRFLMETIRAWYVIIDGPPPQGKGDGSDS